MRHLGVEHVRTTPCSSATRPAHAADGAKPRPRTTTRRAYILIAVLGFTALATSLGLSFLESNTTLMPEAVNLYGKVRAEYLAGSGFAMASHYLMYPPTTVPVDGYWTGACGVGVDGGGDYFDVAVLRSDAWTPPRNDPNLYRISAIGVAKNPDGSVRGKRSITAEVQAPLTGRWNIPYGLLCTTTITGSVPAGVSVYGDIHSNGMLNGLGWCQGNVSAVLTATWTGTGPPASLTSSAPSFPSPSASVAYYSPTYTIRGRTYSAYTSYSKNYMGSGDASALNAVDMSANNPGRIIRAPNGNFRLRRDVRLTGTLIVQGNLELDSRGIELTALNGFPALVVQGSIAFVSDDAAAIVTGPILCSGAISDAGRKNCSLIVTGPVITRSGCSLMGSGTQFRFYWDANRALFWDVEGKTARTPLTVLSWKES